MVKKERRQSNPVLIIHGRELLSAVTLPSLLATVLREEVNYSSSDPTHRKQLQSGNAICTSVRDGLLEFKFSTLTPSGALTHWLHSLNI